MHSLTPLRTAAAAAAAALAGVLAVAPQASAAIGSAGFGTPPRVTDGGRSLTVPLDGVSADQAAGVATAQQMADSFAGSWLGGVLQYAADHSASATPTCRMTVAVTDPNGAAGSATEVLPDQGTVAPLTIMNRTKGTRWGAGDVDHFSTKTTCTDMRGNGQLSNVTQDQDAVVG
ncbi:hypothetical protein [Actinospica robiniae]|uniref:hypothetical protein n=1 Tax=Actinospica robiniae TaxID=304901 RepID=UPI00041700E7|nr:hypothetical protein [Actinospica robiniae]